MTYIVQCIHHQHGRMNQILLRSRRLRHDMVRMNQTGNCSNAGSEYNQRILVQCPENVQNIIIIEILGTLTL